MKMIGMFAIVGMLAFGSLASAQGVNLYGATDASVDADISVEANATTSADVTTNNEAEVENTGVIMITRDSLSAEVSGVASAAADVGTGAELEAYATAILQADENVSDVSLSEDAVSLRYKQPAKLFAFISTSLTVEASVDARGTVTVSYPWYSFLYSTNETEVEAAIMAAVPSVQGSASAGLSAAAQAEILETVHAALLSEARAFLSVSN